MKIKKSFFLYVLAELRGKNSLRTQVKIWELYFTAVKNILFSNESMENENTHFISLIFLNISFISTYNCTM
jgi:hypothetical protein